MFDLFFLLKTRSNTFQKPGKMVFKKSEEDLYGRSNPPDSAGGEGNGRGYYPQRASSIQQPSRPSALPAPRFSSNQNREKEVHPPPQYPGIPRRRIPVGTELFSARGSMLPTSTFGYSGASSARPGQQVIRFPGRMLSG